MFIRLWVKERIIAPLGMCMEALLPGAALLLVVVVVVAATRCRGDLRMGNLYCKI